MTDLPVNHAEKVTREGASGQASGASGVPGAPGLAGTTLPAASVTASPTSSASPGSDAMRQLPLPSTVNRYRVRWTYAISIGLLHLLLPLAFVPWLFSWTGVVVMAAGLYVFGTLGINMCFHRLLAHRSFACPRWLEHFCAILGVCCLQEGPGRWVAIHRKHHQHSDEEPDPHSPLVAFVWGHVGWLILENRSLDSFQMYQQYVRDLLSQPFYLRLERRLCWLWIYLAHAALFFLGGFLGGWWAGGHLMAGVQLGLSVVLWGVLVRTVLVWHITWSVNSFTHLWGYRSYETGENSRNNWFVALISNGEGWHNNHHADQRAAAHGWKWWEFDITYVTIRALGLIGLAWDIKTPDRPRAVPLKELSGQAKA